jgi:YesN/AraC family two-component response regulator
MKLYFAKQVSRLQQGRSTVSYVEKCKVYIKQNLNVPFTLDDIADSININKRYLSRKFSEEEDSTIMEYVRRKRVQAAANMLKYSDEKNFINSHLPNIPRPKPFWESF